MVPFMFGKHTFEGSFVTKIQLQATGSSKKSDDFSNIELMFGNLILVDQIGSLQISFIKYLVVHS